MTDFVARHLNTGDFYHRRDDIGAQDIGFILTKASAGVPPAHIARQAGRCLVDVKKVIDEFMLVSPGRVAPSYVKPRRRAGIRFGAMISEGYTFSIVMTVPPDDLAGRLGIELEPLLWSRKAILAYVARKYGLTTAALLGPRTTKGIAHPRQEAMWLMRQQERWSLPQIGRFMGGRDHTTVLYGVRKHQERLDEAKAAVATPLPAEAPKLRLVA